MLNRLIVALLVIKIGNRWAARRIQVAQDRALERYWTTMADAFAAVCAGGTCPQEPDAD